MSFIHPGVCLAVMTGSYFDMLDAEEEAQLANAETQVADEVAVTFLRRLERYRKPYGTLVGDDEVTWAMRRESQGYVRRF